MLEGLRACLDEGNGGEALAVLVVVIDEREVVVAVTVDVLRVGVPVARFGARPCPFIPCFVANAEPAKDRVDERRYDLDNIFHPRPPSSYTERSQRESLLTGTSRKHQIGLSGITRDWLDSRFSFLRVPTAKT